MTLQSHTVPINQIGYRSLHDNVDTVAWYWAKNFISPAGNADTPDAMGGRCSNDGATV